MKQDGSAGTSRIKARARRKRLALGPVRANKAKEASKRRKTPGWGPDFLLEIL
jgi:hypothetical protein